jgi:hypothetical protein
MAFNRAVYQVGAIPEHFRSTLDQILRSLESEIRNISANREPYHHMTPEESFYQSIPATFGGIMSQQSSSNPFLTSNATSPRSSQFFTTQGHGFQSTALQQPHSPIRNSTWYPTQTTPGGFEVPSTTFNFTTPELQSSTVDPQNLYSTPSHNHTFYRPPTFTNNPPDHSANTSMRYG